MLIVKHLMPAGSTVEDAQRIMQDPEIAAKLGKIGINQKSTTKARMTVVWGSEIAETFLPTARRAGRPNKEEEKSVWHPLAAALLNDIAAKLEEKLPLSEDFEFWTTEKASLASNVIHERYTNEHSAVVNATKFRNILRSFGVDDSVLNATKRPDVTEAHNAKNDVRQEERQKEGINIPDEFKNIADLIARAEVFIAEAPSKRPTSMNAADFMVIMTARPKEAEEAFRPGPNGGVIGALKKRGDADEYPIVSAIGPELAFQYLVSWRARDHFAIKAAMNALTERVKKWGIKRPDLRAIGAELAVRTAAENEEAVNSGQMRVVRDMALKHGNPKDVLNTEFELLEHELLEPESKTAKIVKKKTARKAAQDHYTRVNDPTIRICAKLSNSSLENQVAVDSFLSMTEEQQKTIRTIIAAIK